MSNISPNNLTRIAFIDYYRILTQLIHDGQTPTMEISQHDKDTVTYRDLADTLIEITSQITELSATQSGVALDAVGFVVNTLIAQGVITEAQSKEIQQNLIQDWTESTYGTKNNTSSH